MPRNPSEQWRRAAFAAMALAGFLGGCGNEPRESAASGDGDPPGVVERGRYLTALGDCVACHTAKDDKPFAGGRPVQTPFGAVYSTNITPDAETGIGAWSEAEFYRAMHEGVERHGKDLYPAFPYTSYTLLPRADVRAIRTYLATVAPVHRTPPPNEMAFPLSWRPVLKVWKALFFKPGTFVPDPAKPAEWNRGAYLVRGLAHCGECHTPRNMLGALKDSSELTGGAVEEWQAVDITADRRSGIGAWSDDDIIGFLKTGRTEHKAFAFGPMAEVVTASLQYASDEDLKAIVAYLRTVPAGNAASQATAPGNGTHRGEALYVDNCSACHRLSGTGKPGAFPPLKGSAVVQAADPKTLVSIVRLGADGAPTTGSPAAFSMPAFGDRLNDQDIADLIAYVRTSWGNSAR